jgi:hypothetical protein
VLVVVVVAVTGSSSSSSILMLKHLKMFHSSCSQKRFDWELS